MIGPVTAAAFARMKGVSKVAVQKAVQTGRLDGALIEVPGKKKLHIDPVKAAELWERNTDHSKRHNGGETTPEFIGGLTFQQAKLKEAQAKAALIEIELKQKNGTLVERDKVRADSFKLARAVRENLQNIPDRISAELAGITDPHVVHTKLAEEIRLALEALAEVAAGDDDD